MAKVITKVLVRIGDHDVLFAANKDGVLVPNENGLKVIRDHYGYEDGSPIDVWLDVKYNGYSSVVILVVDYHCVDAFESYTVIDIRESFE